MEQEHTIKIKDYAASFEFNEVSAYTLDDFIKKVKELITDGRDITNIAAIVVTAKSS